MVLGRLQNAPAGIMAMIGGVFLTMSGWVGMVDTLTFIASVLDRLNITNEYLTLTLRILIFFAALGGISIIIGGFLMYKNWPRIGRILVILGLGVGLFGLLVQVGMAWYNGTLDEFRSYMTHSIQGLGILLSFISTRIAEG